MNLKQPPLYFIQYFQGKRLIETIRQSQPMSRTTMKHMIQELRRTTHKTGQLIPVRWN